VAREQQTCVQKLNAADEVIRSTASRCESEFGDERAEAMGGYWSIAQFVTESAERWMYSLVRSRVQQNPDMENWEEVEQRLRAEIPAETQEAWNKESAELVDNLFEATKGATFTLAGIVTLESKVPEGTIVKAVSIALANILQEIEEDWSKLDFGQF
jgi:hypothetical protein